jgi:hypothetical protein
MSEHYFKHTDVSGTQCTTEAYAGLLVLEEALKCPSKAPMEIIPVSTALLNQTQLAPTSVVMRVRH